MFQNTRGIANSSPFQTSLGSRLYVPSKWNSLTWLCIEGDFI